MALPRRAVRPVPRKRYSWRRCPTSIRRHYGAASVLHGRGASDDVFTPGRFRKRFPSVPAHPHFIECSGNSGRVPAGPETTPGQLKGPDRAFSEWTGAARLISSSGGWRQPEGVAWYRRGCREADAKHPGLGRHLPMASIAYGQETARRFVPEQGSIRRVSFFQAGSARTPRGCAESSYQTNRSRRARRKPSSATPEPGNRNGNPSRHVQASRWSCERFARSA